MRRFIVIGDSGFIGSAFLEYLVSQNHEVIGVNRNLIRQYQASSSLVTINNLENDLFSMIRPYVNMDTIVINCAWEKISREFRNSVEHFAAADREVELIRVLSQFNVRYLSFGSIAELSEVEISPSYGSTYSQAKTRVYENLMNSQLAYTWMRIASCYGENDSREWFLTKLVNSISSKSELIIERPNLMINLCHISSLVNSALNLSPALIGKALNLYTPQWVTLNNLKKSAYELTEPKYEVRSYGAFSSSDPEGHEVESPPIVDFFTRLKFA